MVRSRSASGSSVLSARGLAKQFGSVVALGGVDIDLYSGDIVGLQGPNGAGKTTLFDILSGFCTPDAGTVRLGDREVNSWSPEALASTCPGLVRSFQEVRLFEQMTVIENVLVARRFRAGTTIFGVFRRWAIMKEKQGEVVRALEILKAVGLEGMERRQAHELSYGQRKLLELGRCLARDDGVVLLDEPFAGVNSKLIDLTTALVHEARDIGRQTFLIVDHNTEALTKLCDVVWRMDHGRIFAQDINAPTPE